MNRGILPFVAAAPSGGCKIIQTSTSGGSIVSASGNYDCAEGSTCKIDVPNGELFAESFSAVARHGYAFAGWRGSESYLCAGNTPLCVVDIPSSVTVYDAAGVVVREGAAFRSIEFHSPDGRDGQTITANASFVLTNPLISLAD